MTYNIINSTLAVITILFLTLSNFVTADLENPKIETKDLLKISKINYKIDPVPELFTTLVNNSTETPQNNKIIVEPLKLITEETKPLTVDTGKEIKSNIKDLIFLQGKKQVKGSELVEAVTNNPNGVLFYNTFQKKYGIEVAETMAISLMYENGTMWEKTVGVCDKPYQIDGNYRNCNFANRNSAGLDIGVKQINTFWQRDRVKKLSSIKCNFENKAVSKNRNNECNQKFEKWLIVPENNLEIAIDIYKEHNNFCSWYGYKKAFTNHTCNKK